MKLKNKNKYIYLIYKMSFNPSSQQIPATSDGPMNNTMGSNNPKLQSVNYVTILPEGKTSGYKPGQQIDFKIDPVQFPYIDGKQSYLLLNVEPTGTFSNGGAASVPLCFPPNMGANALVNRLTCRVNDGTGRIIEDRESYNLYNGIMNSYTHDSDVFPSLAKVEGVSGRTNAVENRNIDNINTSYFYPLPDVSDVAGVGMTGGNTLLQQNSFVIPIQLGLFSAFSGQHQAVPNMDIGGCHITYYLETANRVLQTLSHKFYKSQTINGVSVDIAYGKEIGGNIPGNFTSTTLFEIGVGVCDPALVVNGVPYDLSMCAYRVGMPIFLGSGAKPEAIITKIGIVGGKIQVTLDQPIGAVGADELNLGTISERDYSISKAELRVLNTVPDGPTMKNIRRAVQRGINFNTTQLYKVSTAASLKNAVIDVPESLTKCLSIMAVPCQQNGLQSTDAGNSYIYPRPDSIFDPLKINDYSYQWQVRQVLIPNLQVETNRLVDAKSDNVIYFNQQIMAQRPMYPVRSLADNVMNLGANALDLNLPYFFPLLLAPMGSSFDLIDSAPQLRIENTDSANTTAKLYFIFVNHVRKLTASDSGVVVEF